MFNKQSKKRIIKYRAIPDKENYNSNSPELNFTKNINVDFLEEKNLIFSLLGELGVSEQDQKKCLEMLYKDWCIKEKYENNVIPKDFDTFIKYCINNK